jgi:hypothetical protein
MTTILKLDQQLKIRFRNYLEEGQRIGEVHFKTVLFVSLCPTFPYTFGYKGVVDSSSVSFDSSVTTF